MKFFEMWGAKMGTVGAGEVANFAYLSSQVSFARLISLHQQRQT
jgi:hypothetical protein